MQSWQYLLLSIGQPWVGQVQCLSIELDLEAHLCSQHYNEKNMSNVLITWGYWSTLMLSHQIPMHLLIPQVSWYCQSLMLKFSFQNKPHTQDIAMCLLESWAWQIEQMLHMCVDSRDLILDQKGERVVETVHILDPLRQTWRKLSKVHTFSLAPKLC